MTTTVNVTPGPAASQTFVLSVPLTTPVGSLLGLTGTAVDSANNPGASVPVTLTVQAAAGTVRGHVTRPGNQPVAGGPGGGSGA